MNGTETGDGPMEMLPRGEEMRFRLVHGIALAAVMLLALALRLYRLSDQSLWWDEFVAFGYLDSPDLASHLRFLRALFPEHGAAPLYYIIQYFAARWTGMSAETLRLLPVALAVSAVPLLYGFVRHLCGEKAGLLAALCLALSPQHIWYAQELRPYELVTPLAVISVWSFMRAYRGGSPVWWVVNLISNTLLGWTHLLTVFLILTEGLFLLLFSLRRFRRVVVWSAVQLLLLIPSAVSVRHMVSGNNYIGFRLPFLRFLLFILGGDVLPFHAEINPAWKEHGAAFAVFPRLVPLSYWMGWGLLAVFIGVSFWAFARLVLSWWQWPRTAEGGHAEWCRVENLTLLLLMLFVPGMAVVLLCLSCNSVIFTTYFMYSQMALYALVGTALMAVPGALPRRGAIVAVVGLYMFQLLVFLPEVTRANWKGAAAYIRNNASTQDEVIDIEYFYTDRELKFYLSPQWPVRLVETLQAACDDSARILQSIPAHAPDGVSKRVWIVVQPFYLNLATENHFDCVTALLQAFQDRGLRPSIKEFPGQNGIIVCSVERCGIDVRGIGMPVMQIEPGVNGFSGILPPPIDYGAVLDELGFQSDVQGDRHKMLAALRESVDHWPLDEKFPGCARFNCIAPILDLVCRGHADLAGATARHLIAQHPDYGLLHMALGIALLKEQQNPAAREAFAAAGKLNGDLGLILAPFLDALSRNDNFAAACDEARKLERSGFWYAPALRAACGSDGASTSPVCIPPSTLLRDGPTNISGNACW